VLWYCYVATCSDAADLLGPLDGFFDWWDTGGDTVDDFVDQYGAHSDHFVVSQAVMDAWMSHLPAFVSGGWQYSAEPFGLDRPSYHLHLSEGQAVTLNLSFGVSLGSTWTRQASALIKTVDIPKSQLSGQGSYFGAIRTFSFADGQPLGACGQAGWVQHGASCGLYGNYKSGSPALVDGQVALYSDDLVAGEPFGITLDFPQAGAAGADVYIPVDDAFEVVTQYTGGHTDQVQGIGALDFLPTSTFVNTLPDGSTVNVPESVDEVVGVVPVPGVIPDEAVGSVDEPGFWEGLFDGVTSGLGTIEDVLSDILTAVQGIPAFIADFPAILLDAIQTLFVPTQTIQEHFATVIDTLCDQKEPCNSYVVARDGMLSFFDGVGDTCITFQLPNPRQPFGALMGPFRPGTAEAGNPIGNQGSVTEDGAWLNANACPRSEWTEFGWLVSEVAVGVLYVIWGWTLAERVLFNMPGGGGYH
jgi:hypothetical protein